MNKCPGETKPDGIFTGMDSENGQKKGFDGEERR